MIRVLPAKPLIVLCIAAILCQTSGLGGPLGRPPGVRTGAEAPVPIDAANASSPLDDTGAAPSADSLGTYFLAADKVRSLATASAGGVDPATAQAFDAALVRLVAILEELSSDRSIADSLIALRSER